MPLLNWGSCCHCTAERALMSQHNLGLICRVSSLLHSITRLFPSKSYFLQESSATLASLFFSKSIFSHFFLCLHFIMPTSFCLLLLSIIFLSILLLFPLLLFSLSLQCLVTISWEKGTKSGKVFPSSSLFYHLISFSLERIKCWLLIFLTFLLVHMR